jgi:transcriptional regulator with XRE-family HTH domain
LKRQLNYEEIGNRIRHQRKHLGFTQEELAEECEISTAFEGHIERGTRKLSVHTLVQISNALKVSTDYLLFGNRFSDTERLDEIAIILSSIEEHKAQYFLSAIEILAKHLDEMDL